MQRARHMAFVARLSGGIECRHALYMRGMPKNGPRDLIAFLELRASACGREVALFFFFSFDSLADGAGKVKR